MVQVHWSRWLPCKNPLKIFIFRTKKHMFSCMNPWEEYVSWEWTTWQWICIYQLPLTVVLSLNMCLYIRMLVVYMWHGSVAISWASRLKMVILMGVCFHAGFVICCLSYMSKLDYGSFEQALRSEFKSLIHSISSPAKCCSWNHTRSNLFINNSLKLSYSSWLHFMKCSTWTLHKRCPYTFCDLLKNLHSLTHVHRKTDKKL